MKYTDTMVTFREVPDETSLCLNISGCPNHCPACHSKELWENIGYELTAEAVDAEIQKNDGITCVCFMGGDQDPKGINELAAHVKSAHKGIKTCWYTGKTKISTDIELKNFDFVKVGPYIEENGPLDDPNTNQSFWLVKDDNLIDITNKFWRRQP